MRGAYFEQISMVGIDLSGADLGGVFMHGCHVSKSIIRNANLCAANVKESSFIDSDLSRTNMWYMNASLASFRGAKISGGAIQYAILARTEFRGANITARNICGSWNLIWNTIMPDGTIVEGPQWGDGR
ncbi:MAG: pentapeptide repeat-containing protein [Hydrococcus sp. SU_1_0]|nr:pentapeptide repeat-containing protein [Hydrococcus sp. SU_1_0]